MIAAGYSRVSSQGQVSGDGHVRQEKAISDFAATHNYELVKIFNEDAVTGKSEIEDRPAFQEMLAWCLANDCKTILVEALDRLAREYRVQEQLLIYLATKEISLIACNTAENVTEALKGDPMRRALIQIQGILAELDRNLIVAKLMKARKRRRDNGERCEGQPPYGWKAGEPEILKDILRLAHVWPAEVIADHLNARNILTRHGKKWHATQIRRIVSRARQSGQSSDPLPDHPIPAEPSKSTH